MPLTSGATFGEFTIVRLLGSERTGEAYLVTHPKAPRQYALKILSDDMSADAEFRQRFLREAKLAAALDHRHIVPVHHRGVHKGQLWILMDHVDGPDIGHLLQQRHPDGMPMRQVLRVVKAVAAALDYAHQRGLLHRDVKPSNILLTAPQAGKRRILLSDFGLARRLELSGEAIDEAADQYALAATTFHLLTGSPPFPDTDAGVTINGRLTAAPPRVEDFRPELRAVATALGRALSKDPNERFDTCSQFAEALVRAADEQHEVTTAATRTAHAQTLPPLRTPHRLTAGLRLRPPRLPGMRVIIAVLAAAILAGGIFVGTQLAGNRHPVPASTATPSPPTASAQPSGTAAAAPLPPGCGDPNAILSSMTIRDKLAQLVMVGVTGAADARAVVANQHVGGIFIGSWTDLSMLKNGSLTDIASSAGPLPLAVSVDEEGGRVSRLSSLIGEAPSARMLAQSSTPEEVYQRALDRGRKMYALGITIDLAPVVDVTDAPANSVIGDRSFSANPAVVTQDAGAYAKGLRDAGLLPVLKHFPGHGRASGDSHTSGVVTPPLDDLQTTDLVPYRTLVTQSPVGVMIGHLQVPGLTGGDPASLSRAAVDLLRSGTRYGGPPFDGPVFTDDLSSMRAITDRYSVVDAVLRALQAGADNALWVTTTEVPAVLDRLESAVATGELDTKNVDTSVLRMAAAKSANGRCGR